MGTSIAKPGERGALVEGDMVGLAALDLVLWIVRTRMVGIAFDLKLARMHPDDGAADAARLGVPAHGIMDHEGLRHGRSIRCRKEPQGGSSRIECIFTRAASVPTGTLSCRFLKIAISFD